MREPVNASTHLAGALLSAVGLVLLVRAALLNGSTYDLVSFTIFGLSLILLYLASGLYHGLRLSERGQLTMRKLDHLSIFLLIAGTYTPFCLGPLRGPWGWGMLAAVWGLAVLGSGVKLLWMGAPRWLSVSFYVVMGWLVVAAFYPLVQAAPPASVAWLVAGGLIYTLGAVVYATKRPNPLPAHFGFHEIWHLFVLAGSLSHFVAVFQLVG